MALLETAMDNELVQDVVDKLLLDVDELSYLRLVKKLLSWERWRKRTGSKAGKSSAQMSMNSEEEKKPSVTDAGDRRKKMECYRCRYLSHSRSDCPNKSNGK